MLMNYLNFSLRNICSLYLLLFFSLLIDNNSEKKEPTVNICKFVSLNTIIKGDEEIFF